jgi:NhaA family Na+:H+ antiporter
LFGVSVVAGIGFTVAIFIAALAFPGNAALLMEAKLGIVLGSLAAGLIGSASLFLGRGAEDLRLGGRASHT